MSSILIVEDEPMIRDLLTRALLTRGYQVTAAPDGARGVAMARSELPALIIMDMGLPILNGWQATYRIRCNPVTQHIPIIALTAYALPEEKQHCLAVGCNTYEPKPIEMTRLFAKIADLLPH